VGYAKKAALTKFRCRSNGQVFDRQLVRSLRP